MTPEYINRRWTEEQFQLLFIKRNKRIRFENGDEKQGKKNMSDVDFFAAIGVKPQVAN